MPRDTVSVSPATGWLRVWSNAIDIKQIWAMMRSMTIGQSVSHRCGEDPHQLAGYFSRLPSYLYINSVCKTPARAQLLAGYTVNTHKMVTRYAPRAAFLLLLRRSIYSADSADRHWQTRDRHDLPRAKVTVPSWKLGIKEIGREHTHYIR